MLSFVRLISISIRYVLTMLRGYDLQNGQPGRVTGDCLSQVSSGQIITYTAQAANGSWVSETLTVASATSMRAIAMDGWNVSPSATTTTTSASSLSTALPSSTPTNSPSQSHELSTGAKAGIGAGIAVAVIGLLALVFFLYRNRRKSNPPNYMMTKSEMSGENQRLPHEMNTRATAYEMYQRPPELESSRDFKSKHLSK